MTDDPTLRPDPYCGPAPGPETLILAWNGDPVVLGALGLATLAGLRHLGGADAARPGRRRAFGVAAGAAVLVFLSPLCALTVALFTARGIHHLVLILVLAPALAHALPLGRRRRRGGAASFVLLSVALWAWHVPALYAAAWDHAAVYWLMQAALGLPAWVFWSCLLHGVRAGGGADPGAGLYLSGLAVQMGLIGAILTFAPRLLYAEHLTGTAAFGIDPLHDQQLAGLVMWVPGMVPLVLMGGMMLRRGWGALDARAPVPAPGRVGERA